MPSASNSSSSKTFMCKDKHNLLEKKIHSGNGVDLWEMDKMTTFVPLYIINEETVDILVDDGGCGLGTRGLCQHRFA